MNIQHLKYVIEVERTGSITQAAENLFMNQPNLSKVIRELEDEMGFTIFKRSSRGIELTQRGTAFLEYAKRVVALTEEMEALNRPQDENIQRFSIATPVDACIGQAFIRFSAQLDPGQKMDINFIETGLMDTLDCVERGRTGLGVIRYRKQDEKQFSRYIAERELKSSVINQFSCCLLMSRRHPLAEAETITGELLRDYVELVQADVTLPRVSSGGSAKAAGGKRIWVYDRGTQLSLLSENANAYLWSNPIPVYLLERYQLVQRACPAPDNSYKDVLIWEKRHRTTPLEQAFLDQLTATLEDARKAEIR